MDERRTDEELQGPGVRRPRRLAAVLATVLCVLLVGTGVYVWNVRPLRVVVAPARTGVAMDAVYASGVVDYARQANIAAVVSAPIVAVAVTEGERVRQGQLLARLEDGPQAAAAAQLEAQASLSRAGALRAERLAQAGFGPQAAAQDARSQLRAARGPRRRGGLAVLPRHGAVRRGRHPSRCGARQSGDALDHSLYHRLARHPAGHRRSRRKRH
jgi:multidrug efflux pump subunit AcrA (membrane-fusion protein)